MYDIIKRYVDNENKNGLMLIDMPTGSGKTYSAIKYIFDACMDPQNKDRKYIFVTVFDRGHLRLERNFDEKNRIGSLYRPDGTLGERLREH